VSLKPRRLTSAGEVCGIELELQTAKSGMVLRCGHVFNKQAFKTYVQTTIIDGEVSLISLIGSSTRVSSQ
jgi:hypothetical protein